MANSQGFGLPRPGKGREGDVDPATAARVCELLQYRLVSLSDLSLTLKHVHWNVVGPNFIGIHRMLDPHADAVRVMVDDLAERIAALGGEPWGTPGKVVAQRDWEDYGVGRASTKQHLARLERVYGGIISDHRECIAELEDLDLVSQDLLLDQTERLEEFRWLVAAHLQD